MLTFVLTAEGLLEKYFFGFKSAQLMSFEMKRYSYSLSTSNRLLLLLLQL